jgi:NhaP-type Na+/H+ or K+/H+ antiporter
VYYVVFVANSWDNEPMHDDDKKHPGPWRVMQVDSGFAGILVSAGFLWLFLAGMPFAQWFLLGAVLLAGIVVLVLRLTSKQ